MTLSPNRSPETVTTIADIFDLPERVHQGDFVLRLSEGVERAERTLNDYVVTEQLAGCFDDALSLIGSAVQSNTSKGAYLHGSFGSGKSHFMAVLNQRDQMRTRIRNCLLAAYGISGADVDAVDDSHDLEGHFISLNPGLEVRPPVAASIGGALQDVFGQWLTARYPDHPEFGVEVRRPGLRRVLEVVERAVVAPEKRVEVERQSRSDVRHIAVPLGLGAMGETHFVLERTWLDELERKHAQHGGDPLSVRELRAWIEAPERRGLDRDVQNLLILTFALQKGLRFSLHGQPATPSIEKLDDSLVLVAQALPDAADWEGAVTLAQTLFGIEVSGLMNAHNVAELTDALRCATEEHRDAAAKLVDSLTVRMDARGIAANGTNRYRTAHATRALLSALADAKDDALVATLAKAEVQTSDAAMAQCLRSARGVAEALASGGWSVVDTTDKLGEPYRERVQAIAAKLNDALGHDEHVTQLAGVLESCHTAALELLTEAATRPPSKLPGTPEPPAQEPPQKTDKPAPDPGTPVLLFTTIRLIGGTGTPVFAA